MCVYGDQHFVPRREKKEEDIEKKPSTVSRDVGIFANGEEGNGKRNNEEREREKREWNSGEERMRKRARGRSRKERKK